MIRTSNPVLHFDNGDGKPLSGGWLYTFVAGTNTPIATYADMEGTKNPVQIPLDSRGECSVFLEPGRKYKFRVMDSSRLNVVQEADNVSSEVIYTAAGSDTITVETTTVDGKTTSTFSVAAGSIDKSRLKGTRDLIPDTQYISMERQEGSGEVILSLAAEVPDNDGTYVLKMVNGTMTWVAE